MQPRRPTVRDRVLSLGPVRERLAWFPVFVFRAHAVQRGDPFLVDVSLVIGSKEPLGPAEKARVMLSPRQALSGPKTLGYQRLIMVDGRDGVETSDHRRWTVWIRKHRGLFSRKKKAVLCRVVGDVARSCLGTQPFAKLSLMEVGLFDELL